MSCRSTASARFRSCTPVEGTNQFVMTPRWLLTGTLRSSNQRSLPSTRRIRGTALAEKEEFGQSEFCGPRHNWRS